jgi:hypothetical protein
VSALSVGDTVKVGSLEDSVFVIRCRTARPGWYHLVSKVADHPTLITRVEPASALRLVKPAPTFKTGERVVYQDRPATILEDLGDNVELASGLSKITVSKYDIVLAQL